MTPLLQAAAPIFANLSALRMQIGAALLLALLFAVVRRQVEARPWFRLWELAWGVLAVSLVAMLLRHTPGMPLLATSMVYQVGKCVFFALLVMGALAFERPGRPLPVGPGSAVAVFVGVVTAWVAETPNDAVLWQSPFAAVLCGVAGWRILVLSADRRTLGTNVTAGALCVYALMWAFYGLHIGAPDTGFGAAMAPLVRNQVYIDSLSLMGLGFGMVLLVMEDARRTGRESEERLQTLIASTTDALLLLDGTLRVKSANPAAARLFDAAQPALAGRDLLTLLEVGDSPGLRAALLGFAGAEEREFRMGESEPMLARRGAGIPVRVEGSLWRLPGGRGELAAILRDVTVREELRSRQAMQAKTDAVRQLAAGIAHDFNNLLTTISTRSQMLLQEAGGDERVREAMTEIARSTASAARLARDLLAMSGRQSLEPSMLDVNSAVRALEATIRGRLPAGVAADFRYAQDAGRVRVDGVRFGDALLALAQNAGEAMEASGGRILVATARGVRAAEARTAGVDERAEYAYVSVHDTGLGLSVESRAHLFEPFYSTKGEGRGLGLPTALGFAQQSGGWLSVQSSPAGTIVRLGFPLAQDDDAPIRSAARPSGPTVVDVASLSERWALLAEDDDTVRRVVRVVLIRQGYKVIEASNGVTALEAWHASRPTLAVVVADVEMPRMGGPELVKRLLQLQPGVRVILMSGYVADDAVRAAIPLANVTFLQKPFDVNDLTRVLRDTPEHM